MSPTSYRTAPPRVRKKLIVPSVPTHRKTRPRSDEPFARDAQLNRGQTDELKVNPLE